MPSRARSRTQPGAASAGTERAYAGVLTAPKKRIDPVDASSMESKKGRSTTIAKVDGSMAVGDTPTAVAAAAVVPFSSRLRKVF